MANSESPHKKLRPVLSNHGKDIFLARTLLEYWVCKYHLQGFIDFFNFCLRLVLENLKAMQVKAFLESFFSWCRKFWDGFLAPLHLYNLTKTESEAF